jgi:hypothetical protein
MASELDAAIECWQGDTETVLAAVRALPTAAWQAQSGNPGWSNKDVLVHLATGYAQRLELLRSIVETGAPGPLPDADSANAANIAALGAEPVDTLIARLIAIRAEVLALLQRLRVDHLDLQVAIGARMERLGDYARDMSRHDLDHLGELRPDTSEPR